MLSIPTFLATDEFCSRMLCSKRRDNPILYSNAFHFSMKELSEFVR